MSNNHPDEWVCIEYTEALADGIEAALRTGWTEDTTVEERLAFASKETVSQGWSELLASLVA